MVGAYCHVRLMVRHFCCKKQVKIYINLFFFFLNKFLTFQMTSFSVLADYTALIASLVSVFVILNLVAAVVFIVLK